MNLAFIGSINDEILDKTELAAELARFLIIHYRGMMEERYQLEEGTDYEPYQVLEQIARIRACLLKGNELDIKKAANLFLDDFRSGKLGRISLEFPPSVPSEDRGRTAEADEEAQHENA